MSPALLLDLASTTIADRHRSAPPRSAPGQPPPRRPAPPGSRPSGTGRAPARPPAPGPSRPLTTTRSAPAGEREGVRTGNRSADVSDDVGRLSPRLVGLPVGGRELRLTLRLDPA